MLILMLAFAAATTLAPVLIRQLGRPAFGLLALVPAAGFVWTIAHYMRGTFDSGGELTLHLPWLSSLNLDFDLRMDGLSAFFTLIIMGAGALVLIYCWGYFDTAPRRLRAFAGQMVAFAGVMFGLVVSDSFLLLYIFWELTSVLSFLLVGYYAERASSRRAANQALMVTVLGGLTMLVGMVLFGQTTGVWHFSEISQLSEGQLTGHAAITTAVALISVGALTKSAIAPAHFWLPGAMAAPTPVSAYLHSAAMVKAGIYLIARLAPDLHVVDSWHLIIIPLGLFTMLLGGWTALHQKDLKLVLAYSTVSQLGFIMAIVAVGSRDTLMAGLALTAGHSLFKAALFMVVGTIDHTTGTRDTTELSGLGRRQPLLVIISVIAAASMSGIPPLVGFVAKEGALTALMEDGHLEGVPDSLMLTGVVLGSILTVAYSAVFLYGAFATKPKAHATGGGTSEAVEKQSTITAPLWIPMLVLTAATIFLGVWPPLLDGIIAKHLDGVYPGTISPAHLVLWHGFTIPLGLSAAIIALGVAVFYRREQVIRALHFEAPAFGDANAAYDSVLNGLRVVSQKLTASTQRGSVVVNLGIIFVTLTVVPLVALITGHRNEVNMELWRNPWEAVIAAAMVVFAIAALTQKTRLSTVVLVSGTGYSMAVLFILRSAPDLALTQILVETVTMVVLMLVLRKLPTNIEWNGTPKFNRVRAWLSIAVGFTVVLITMFAMSARTHNPISDFIPHLAKDPGAGDNAVNVLLVDIRAFDTFGEITVLVIAATGIASLIYGTRSFRRESRRPRLTAKGRRWLLAGRENERGQNRSVMVEVVTRIVFPSVMVVSIFYFFAGHNSPGGGFAGGLVAALGLCLRYLAGGANELEEALPVDPGRILGVGLLTAVIGALWPIFLGEPPLASHYVDLELPLMGNLHISSVLVFDLGVYLIVIGLVMYILTSLGRQVDSDESARRRRARERAVSLARSKSERKAAARMAASKAAAEAADATTGPGSEYDQDQSDSSTTDQGKES